MPHACRPVSTPSLVVDLDVVEANARRMATARRRAGRALRPHIKTHKSVALARLQLDAGAAGITVGTLGEAEAMVDSGIDEVFVGYPLWADGQPSASDGCTALLRFRSGWTRQRRRGCSPA